MTRLNDWAGIQIRYAWSQGQALLYTHDQARPVCLLSVWGAWYHYPCNLSETYCDFWGVFAASKTQDQCTRHLLWSWDIICWPISFALFWPSSWPGVSVLAGARWGSPNPWELCSFGPEPCQFHGRESSNSPHDFCRFLWLMLYGLFLSKIPVACTSLHCFVPISPIPELSTFMDFPEKFCHFRYLESLWDVGSLGEGFPSWHVTSFLSSFLPLLLLASFSQIPWKLQVVLLYYKKPCDFPQPLMPIGIHKHIKELNGRGLTIYQLVPPHKAFAKINIFRDLQSM